MPTQYFSRKANKGGTRFAHRRASTLRPRALRIEPLEKRYLLAVVTVDTVLDNIDPNDGSTSLREALFATNTIDGPDTINFAPALTAHGPATIHLAQGWLRINDDLTINGPGAGLLTIDAGGSQLPPNVDTSNIFSVGFSKAGLPDLNVTLSGMTLTGTRNGSSGGAIISFGTLTVDGCSIVDNSATVGSAIYNQYGNLTISNSTISGNFGHSFFGGGAAVVMDGRSLTVSNSVFTDNAGALAFRGGRADISKSTFSGNKTNSTGAAIYAGHAELNLTDTTITDNTVTSRADGGGISCWYSDLTAINVTISNNSTDGRGGGIFNYGGRITLNSSLVSNNYSGAEGGGISASRTELSITNSTISGNQAYRYGGGIYRTSIGSATISDSTITGNSTTWGPNNIGSGGIVSKDTSEVLVIRNSIVAKNSRDPGIEDDLGGPAQLFFSILGTNGGTSLAEAPVGAPDANGNLIGGATNGLIDPLLGPLVNNGGATLTHALLPGSPAIDAGDPVAVAGVANVPVDDQRGAPFARVVGGRVDIGAFESQPNPLPGDYDFNGTVDVGDYDVWRCTLGSTTDLRADGNGDGVVDSSDYILWRANIGQTRNAPVVAEPPIVPIVPIVIPHSELAAGSAANAELALALVRFWNSQTQSGVVRVAVEIEPDSTPQSSPKDSGEDVLAWLDTTGPSNSSATESTVVGSQQKSVDSDCDSHIVVLDSALAAVFGESSLGNW